MISFFLFKSWILAEPSEEEANGKHYYCIEDQDLTHQPEVHERRVGYANTDLHCFEVDNLHVDEDSDFENEEPTHHVASAQLPLKPSQIQQSL